MSHVSYAEPPAQGWDIHCHTVFSDGTETPRTLVEQARKLGLHGVAIADHDTTAGWDEATEASEEIGLPLLLGTEITAVDEDVSVHMLAFQYDPSNEHISSMFANTRAARLHRTKRMVDAFADAVSAKSKYYIPTPSPSTHEVIAAVKGAGGVVVAAHAGDPQRNRRLLSDEQLDAMIADGLDGLEIWHRGNPPEQRERLLTIAARHDLLVTGGSDWHGKGKPNGLGENLTDDDTVREILHRGVDLIGRVGSSHAA